MIIKITIVVTLRSLLFSFIECHRMQIIPNFFLTNVCRKYELGCSFYALIGDFTLVRLPEGIKMYITEK